MSAAALRDKVIETAQAMSRLDLNHNTNGNVSTRWGDGFLVTPTGMAYDALRPEDIASIDAAGRVRPGRRPSAEWPMHAALYRLRPDIDAIVHAHAPHATALSALRLGIPPFHYMVAAAGGPDIRCAPYATYGTDALALGAVEAMHDRRACLLANHGLIAAGGGLDRALALAVEVDQLARQYLLARAAGEPVLLTDGEMAEVLAKYADYGRQ